MSGPIEDRYVECQAELVDIARVAEVSFVSSCHVLGGHCRICGNV